MVNGILHFLHYVCLVDCFRFEHPSTNCTRPHTVLFNTNVRTAAEILLRPVSHGMIEGNLLEHDRNTLALLTSTISTCYLIPLHIGYSIQSAGLHGREV